VRVGGALNEKSLPDDRVLPLLPAVPTQTIAAGLTFAVGPRAEATFSYTRAFENSAENPGLPNVPAGQPTNISRNDRVYGFGLSYKF
jgi:long-subunit fatty acid transport protein